MDEFGTRAPDAHVDDHTSTQLTTLAPGNGVTSRELMQFLPKQRVGDPLGMGLVAADRPPAPQDPDIYDPEVEKRSYARSLLSHDAEMDVDKLNRTKGYMTISQVRDLLATNTVNGSVEAGGIDPEFMVQIDSRTNYKIFIAGDNVYTREELYDNFSFHELNVQPEGFFTAQEIGVFAPRKAGDPYQYMARDADDETLVMTLVEDMLELEIRKNPRPARALVRIVKTKIYIGKEQWDDFMSIQRTIRAVTRVTQARAAHGQSGGLGLMLGSGNSAQLMIENTARDKAFEERERAFAAREKALDEKMARMDTMLASMRNARPPLTDASQITVEDILSADEWFRINAC